MNDRFKEKIKQKIPLAEIEVYFGVLTIAGIISLSGKKHIFHSLIHLWHDESHLDWLVEHAASELAQKAE